MKVWWLVIILTAGLLIAQEALDTVFVEDFEGDVSGWQMMDLEWTAIDSSFLGDSVTTYWHRTDSRAYDGMSWWCGDDALGGYRNGWLQYLVTPDISIPVSPTGTPTLVFRSKYNIEPPDTHRCYDSWDAINVRISTDGGATFEVLGSYPTNYTCESMFGFGFNHQGCGVPGWGGSVSTWQTPSFDLSAYEGEDIEIAFAFGSDPAYCTEDNPAMFGWLVDSISVADDEVIYFYDSADDGSDMTPRNMRRPQFWAVTDDDAYSGTYAAHFGNPYEASTAIISPLIHIPDTFLAQINFEMRLCLPDRNGDGDGYLDDYVIVDAVIPGVGGEADSFVFLTLLFQDLVPDSTDFYYIDETYLDRGTLSLRDFIGQDIKLAFIVHTDGNDDGGIGFGVYIDDVVVTGRTGLMHDVGISRVTTGPVNLDTPTRITASVNNPGISDEGTIVTLYRIMTADYSDTLTTGFFTYPDVNAGSWTNVSANYTFDTPGGYIVRVWTSFPPDMDRSNDTLELPITVPTSHEFNAGYDDGNPFEPGTFSYIQSDTLAEAGFAISIPDVPFSTPYYVTDVSVFVHDTFPAILVFYQLNPYDGVIEDEITRYTGITVAAGEDGGWFNYHLSTALEMDYDQFGIAFLNASRDAPLAIGVDFSLPHDTLSWIRLYNSDVGIMYWAKFNAFIEPYDTIDLMMRVKITDGTGIAAQKVARAFDLKQNYPNPFNPVTSISYSLPKASDMSLSVYDVMGRTVRTLVQESQPAGNYALRFDGRDDAGAQLPSGVYFYRLETPEHTLVRRMMLIR